MIELCKKSGNKPPKFEESTGSFSVIFTLKEPISRAAVSPKPVVELTDRQQEIINVLRSGSLTRSQIMSKMKVKLTDRMMQLELAKLRSMKLIKSIGKARSTRLTLAE